MFINIAGGLLLVAVTVVLGWLVRRAWRAGNAILKWGGVVLGGLLTLIAGVLSVVALIGLFKFYAPRSAPVPDLKVEGTPEQIKRGEYLAYSFCVGCHSASSEFPMPGGVDVGKELPLPLGTFVSVNLTPAGPLKNWSDGEIFRILRNGIAPDSRWLVVMSNARVRHLSDEDLKAVIAYVRSQPPVINETQDPPDQPNFLAVVMLGAGLLPEGEPSITGTITAPPKGPTVEYGEYIVSYQDCRNCHGEDLTGGKEGGLYPVGPNLRIVKSWTSSGLIKMFRTGVTPNGQAIDSRKMPWKIFQRLDDEDLTAIYAYLASLP